MAILIILAYYLHLYPSIIFLLRRVDTELLEELFLFLAEPLVDFQTIDVELEFAGAGGVGFDFGDGMVGAVFAFVLV